MGSPVGELAHTNVPGSGRNEKSWQDVLEILSVDIDVTRLIIQAGDFGIRRPCHRQPRAGKRREPRPACTDG